jgi:hypothetical protein
LTAAFPGSRFHGKETVCETVENPAENCKQLPCLPAGYTGSTDDFPEDRLTMEALSV